MKFLVGSCDSDTFEKIIEQVPVLGIEERFVITEGSYFDLTSEVSEKIELEYNEYDEVIVI